MARSIWSELWRELGVNPGLIKVVSQIVNVEIPIHFHLADLNGPGQSAVTDQRIAEDYRSHVTSHLE